MAKNVSFYQVFRCIMYNCQCQKLFNITKEIKWTFAILCNAIHCGLNIWVITYRYYKAIHKTYLNKKQTDSMKAVAVQESYSV